MKAREPTNGLSIEKLKLENIEFSTILTNQEEEEATEAPNKCNLQSVSQSVSQPVGVNDLFSLLVYYKDHSEYHSFPWLAALPSFFLWLIHLWCESFVFWRYMRNILICFYIPTQCLFHFMIRFFSYSAFIILSHQLSSAHCQRRHCRRGRRRCCFTSRAVLLFSNRCQERWRKKL